MKNKSMLKGVLIVVTIGLICHAAFGQDISVTNVPPNPAPSLSSGLQQIYDSINSTNIGVVIGGGRATTGQRNLAFADLLYNFTPSVGAVIGYDYLWAGKSQGHASQANLVKGGINLQADILPFKGFGLTNVVVTPFGSAMVASGNGTVSEIYAAGGKIAVYSKWGLKFNLGAMVEKRTGSGYWDATYPCGFFAVTKGF